MELKVFQTVSVRLLQMNSSMLPYWTSAKNENSTEKKEFILYDLKLENIQQIN